LIAGRPAKPEDDGEIFVVPRMRDDLGSRFRGNDRH